MEKIVIQGLFWPKLGVVENLSIKSFLALGHEYHLYAYGEVENVPDGCIVKDANEIMPYKQYEYYAQFADHFRYKLLYEKGGWWADTDVICNKSFHGFDHLEYVFSSENCKEWGGAMHVNNAVMKCPSKAPLLARFLEVCESAEANISYTSLGPQLIHWEIPRYNLSDFIQPPEVFCPIPWYEVGDYRDEKYNISDYPKAYAFHLWHSVFASPQIFSGIYAELYDKHKVLPNKILIGLETCSKPKYQERTTAIKELWGSRLSDNYDLKICTGKELGCSDEYSFLATKTIAICKYAYDHGYEWLIICDDDTFVRPQYLDIPSKDVDCAGWIEPDNTCTDWTLAHPQGGFYWLSRKAMKIVIDTPQEFGMTQYGSLGLGLEDRWVGLLMHRNSIPMIDLPDQIKVCPTWGWATMPHLNKEENNTPWAVILQIDTLEKMYALAQLEGWKPITVDKPKIIDKIVNQAELEVNKSNISWKDVLTKPIEFKPNDNWKETLVKNKIKNLFTKFKFVAETIPKSSHYKTLCKIYPKHLEEVVDTPKGPRILFVVEHD